MNFFFCICLFLDSACLREKHITFQWYAEKVEVQFLQRETKDWYANISWTPLTGKQTLLMPVITITMMMMMMVMMQQRFLRGFGRKSSFWDSTAHIYLVNSWLKSAYVSNILTNLFESAFKLMKNDVYFITLGWRVIQDFDLCKLKDLRLRRFFLYRTETLHSCYNHHKVLRYVHCDISMAIKQAPGPLHSKDKIRVFRLQDRLFAPAVHSVGESEYGYYKAQTQESPSNTGATTRAFFKVEVW